MLKLTNIELEYREKISTDRECEQELLNSAIARLRQAQADVEKYREGVEVATAMIAAIEARGKRQ